MNFIPNEDEITNDVPWFKDATGEGGWAGHGTGKTERALKSEIITAMNRLGADVIHFKEGTYNSGMEKERSGYLLKCSYNDGSGSPLIVQIKIAALPVENPSFNGSHTSASRRETYERQVKKSKRMALFMFRNSVQGMFYSQMLSPGFLPLMPWFLDESKNMTFGELFTESRQLMLPEPEEPISVEFESSDEN